MPLIRTADAVEAAARRAAGARLVRHAHDMVLDLIALRPAPEWSDPHLAPGLRLETVARPLRELAAAADAAYAPGHPDAGIFPGEIDRRLALLVSGDVTGPIQPDASRAVVDLAGNTVVAAVLVTRLPVSQWWPGGPWVAEIFVTPAWQGQGLGRALLLRAVAVCHAAGETRIGLSVTEGNPAERLYASVGFQRLRTVFVLEAT